ncbi:MAG: PAS domain S-box protein [Bacillota bacterium]
MDDEKISRDGEPFPRPESDFARVLNGLFAHSMNGMAFLKPDFTISGANSVFARLFRIPIEKAQGSGAEQVIPGWTGEIRQNCEEAGRTGQPFQYKGRFSAPGSRGERGDVFFHCDAAPLYTNDGEFQGCLLTFLDVTEYRHAAANSEIRLAQLEADYKKEHSYAKIIEQKYSYLSEMINDGAFWIDPETGAITELNRQAEKITGRPCRDLYQMSYFDLYAPDQQKFAPEKIPAISHESAPFEAETSFVKKDLSPVNVGIRAGRVTIGENQQLLVLVRNMKPVKHLEEELQKSAANLEFILEEAHILYYEWHIPSGALKWSGSHEKVSGFPKSELPRSWEEKERLIHRDDLNNYASAVKSHLKEMEPWRETYRVQRRNGAILTWSESCRIVPDEKGKACRGIGVILDLTGLRRAEETAVYARQQYYSLFNNLREGVFRYRADDGGFFQANPAFLSMFELASTDDLSGIGLDCLFPAPGAPDNLTNAVLKQNLIKQRTLKAKTSRGMDLTASLTAYKSEDLARRVFIEGIVEDVSHLKDMEERIGRHQKNLTTFARFAEQFVKGLPVQDVLSSAIGEFAREFTEDAVVIVNSVSSKDRKSFSRGVYGPQPLLDRLSAILGPDLNKLNWHVAEDVFSKMENGINVKIPGLSSLNPEGAAAPICREIEEKLKVEHTLFIPLMVGGRIIGALIVLACSQSSLPDYSLLESFARYAAAVWELSRAETVRTELSQALDKSSAEYNLLADHTPALILRSDAEGVIKFINAYGSRILGLKTGESMEKLWSALYPHEKELTWKTIRDGLWKHPGRPLQCELADAAHRCQSWTHIPAAGGDGSPAGILSIGQDISDLKKLEQEVAHERMASENFMKTARCPVMLADARGALIKCNQYLEEITGRRGAQIKGANWIETLIPAREQENARYVFLKVLQEMKGFQNIFGLINGVGMELMFEWNLEPVMDGKGEAVSVMIVGRDVTEREQAKKDNALLHKELAVERMEIRKQSEIMKTVMDNIQEGVTIFDTFSGVLFRNKAAVRISGLEGRQLPQEVLKKFSWAEQRPAQQLMGGAEHFAEQEYQEEQAPGQKRKLIVSGRMLPGDTGHTLAGVITFRDVTDYHALTLYKSRLVESIPRSIFVPIKEITGFASSVEQHRTDVEWLNKAVQGMLAAASRAGAMIQDILDAARLDQGQIRFNRQEINMHSFVLNLQEKLKDRLDPARLSVETIKQPLPVVLADPVFLEKILVNILTNAYQYSPPGTPVGVTFQSRDRELAVSVLDQGAGLAQDELPHIFEPYYRTRRAMEIREGTGLGLYLAKKLVEAHGGRIWAESTPGHGCVLSFVLPVAQFL